MLARIVKYGGGDWRSTDAALEKVTLAIESGERIISSDDVTNLLGISSVVLFELALDASDKPSTWFPPGGGEN